jgi:phenazine biosynthesis protein phzE
VTLVDGMAGMTPISGTYRYPSNGPTVEGLLDFLAAEKEIDELHMVVDEELKMMSDVCPGGAHLTGPFLRPMARLAHTEYVIEGRTDLDVLEVLRRTMFAPTVTGSPLRSACRVIAEHERTGRGVYAGALALIDGPTLDSAIAIRTAEIDPAGRLMIGVGATLVRHSDPAAEAAETRIKAAGLVRAFGPPPTSESVSGADPGIFGDPQVRRALEERAGRLSRFWRNFDGHFDGVLASIKIAVIDAEDGFSGMLACQLRALGADVEVCGYDRPPTADVVVIGPGPGDPRDPADQRITALRWLTRQCLESGVPLLAVCLGHQVLADLAGLPLCRNADPAQGLQREIDFFGERLRVGFYNTFSAVADADVVPCPWGNGSVTLQVSRDVATGQIHGLRGPGVRSTQFHPESVLTENGPGTLKGLILSLIRWKL